MGCKVLRSYTGVDAAFAGLCYTLKLAAGSRAPSCRWTPSSIFLRVGHRRSSSRRLCVHRAWYHTQFFSAFGPIRPLVRDSGLGTCSVSTPSRRHG